jgi:hypothetical protein
MLETEKENNFYLSLTRLVNSQQPLGSQAWLNWAKYMMEKGRYTDKMALVEMLSPFSGLPDDGYTTKINRPITYVGTMYTQDIMNCDKDDHVVDEIKTPWPAWQEIAWHVRWPVHHPLYNEPMLWCAKMGFFDVRTAI